MGLKKNGSKELFNAVQLSIATNEHDNQHDNKQGFGRTR
ncbi:hypothetical protein CFter6_0663 [Collimonas fungivorans]|uniref:Uncharacterized protein n=1 Tax=Collimonas fungivorans TaxID=158899 RepID=A0A127P6P9_9BURK|nr:hypothetical protein CFter6_0663 [Collimonas fungivorans]